VPGDHHPAARAIAAANAMTGRVVLADRAQLRASIAGPHGDRRRLAVQAVAEVMAGRPADLTDAAGGPLWGSGTGRDRRQSPTNVAPLPGRVNRLVDCALAQVSASGVVDVKIAAELAIACLDRPTRDGVLVRGLFELDRNWLAMLISCAAWTTDDLAAGVCSVLATVAYRHGDGGLAQVSVDRCLAAEPGNRLTHLLLETMAAGLPPDVLDQLLVPPDSELHMLDPDESGFGPDEIDLDSSGRLGPAMEAAPDRGFPAGQDDGDDAVA
jgi:hypothetical protein